MANRELPNKEAKRFAKQRMPQSEDAVAAGLFAQVFAGDLSVGSMSALKQMYQIDSSDDDLLAAHYEVFIHQVPTQSGLYLARRPEEMDQYVRGLTFYLYRFGLEPPRTDFSPDHVTNLLACSAILFEHNPDVARKFLGYHLRSWLLPLYMTLKRHDLGCFTIPIQDFCEWVTSTAATGDDVPAPPEDELDPDNCDLETLRSYLLAPARAGAYFSHRMIKNWGRICSFHGSTAPRSQTLTALLKWGVDRNQLFQLLQFIQRDCKVMKEQMESVPWFDLRVDSLWIQRIESTILLLEKMMDRAEKLPLHPSGEA